MHNHAPALLDGGGVVVHVDGETRVLLAAAGASLVAGYEKNIAVFARP